MKWNSPFHNRKKRRTKIYFVWHRLLKTSYNLIKKIKTNPIGYYEVKSIPSIKLRNTSNMLNLNVYKWLVYMSVYVPSKIHLIFLLML